MSPPMFFAESRRVKQGETINRESQDLMQSGFRFLDASEIEYMQTDSRQQPVAYSIPEASEMIPVSSFAIN